MKPCCIHGELTNLPILHLVQIRVEAKPEQLIRMKSVYGRKRLRNPVCRSKSVLRILEMADSMRKRIGWLYEKSKDFSYSQVVL